MKNTDKKIPFYSKWGLCLLMTFGLLPVEDIVKKMEGDQMLSQRNSADSLFRREVTSFPD